MMNKTTNDRGQSNARARSFDPVKLLRFSLLCMLVLLCGGSMWAQDVTATLTGADLLASTSPSTSYADYTASETFTGLQDDQGNAYFGRWTYQKNGQNYLNMVQIKKVESSNTTRIQLPKYSGNIKTITLSVTDANSTAYDTGTGAKTQLAIINSTTYTSAVAKNANNQVLVVGSSSTARKTYEFDFTQLEKSYNGEGLYICSIDAAARIWSIVVTYDDGSSDTRAETTLEFGDHQATGSAGGSMDLPSVTVKTVDGATTLTSPEITWASSNTTVATIADGTISFLKGGKTTITASYAGDDTQYKSCSNSFDLTIGGAITDGVFDFNNNQDYGSGATVDASAYITEDKTWTAGNVTLVTSGKYRWYTDGSLRIYAPDEGNTTLKLSVPEGYKITAITITGSSINDLTASTGTYSTGTWSGSSQEVTLSRGSNNSQIKTITVTYTSASAPEAPTFSPAGGTYEEPQAVVLSTTTDEATIYYSTDGENFSVYSGAISVTETTTISAYTKKGEEVSATVTATYTINPPITTITDLNAAATQGGSNGASVKYKFTDIYVAYASGSYNYITDGTNYALLYGSNLGLTAGDQISGSLTGNAKVYNGLPEIAVTASNLSISSKTAGVFTPEASTITIGQLADNVNNYIKVENAEYVSASSKTLTFKVGETNLTVYNQFDLPTTDLTQGKSYDITGFGSINKGNYQIYPTAITEYVAPTPDPLYILGVEGWELPADMKEMTWNAESQAYEYPLNNTSTAYFCFSQTNEINENDWETFNSNYRYGNGIGNFAADEYINSENSITLSKIGGDGNIQLNTAGTWTISVTPDMKMTITGKAAETPAVEDLYVIGIDAQWNLVENMTALEKDNDGNFVLEIDSQTMQGFCFSTKTYNEDNADNWTDFNGGYRYGLATENHDYRITDFTQQYQLVQVNDKNIELTPGKYTITITPQLLMAVTQVEAYSTGYVVAGGYEERTDGEFNEVWNDPLLGGRWDTNNSNNKMTVQNDGTYKLELDNATLFKGTYGFKIVKDGEWYGDPNNNGKNFTTEISQAGIYNAVFTFNPDNNAATLALTKQDGDIPVIVVGDIFPSQWNTEINGNLLEEQADGTFKNTFDFTLDAGQYKCKPVIKYADYDDWIDDPNSTDEYHNFIIDVAETGIYAVTVMLDPLTRATTISLAASTKQTSTVKIDNNHVWTVVQGCSYDLPDATVMAGETAIDGATVTWSTSNPDFAVIENDKIVVKTFETNNNEWVGIIATYAGNDDYVTSSETFWVEIMSDHTAHVHGSFDIGDEPSEELVTLTKSVFGSHMEDDVEKPGFAWASDEVLMVKGDDGKFTMSRTDVQIPSDNFGFSWSIIVDKSTEVMNGEYMFHYEIPTAGTYDITFTYDPASETEPVSVTVVRTDAEEPSGDVTATWDFTSNANPRAVGLFNGTTGTLDSNVAGIVLDIDARNGKFDSQDRTSDAQVNSGTIINVPIKGAGDEVTVVGNWKVSYTIGSEAEAVTDLNKTYTATAADAQQGYVTITSTDNNTYFYSITVVQKATSGEEEEEVTGTFFSAKVAAITAQSFESGTTEITAEQATIEGGKMYAISGQSSAKNLIDVKNNVYYFTMTNNNTYFKVELDHALEVGDVITANGNGGVKNNLPKGLWVSASDTYPTEAPACAGTNETDGFYDNLLSYTVEDGDEYVGKKTLYIFRAAGATQYFDNFAITRPADEPVAEDVTAMWDFEHNCANLASKNDGGAYTETTMASNVEGVSMTIAYNGGQIKNNDNSYQVTNGVVMQIPVKATGDEVTVVGYPGYFSYSVGGTDATEQTTTHKATADEAAQGYVTVTSTNDNNYINSITVVQKAPKPSGLKEKAIIDTDFQDWAKSSTTTEVTTKYTKENITFTYSNASVDPEATNSKFPTTTDAAYKGYIMSDKSEATITTTTFANITKIRYRHGATGSNRGWGLKMKVGDGEWETVSDATVGSTPAWIEKTINKENVQLQWYNLNIEQNAYMFELEVYANVDLSNSPLLGTLKANGTTYTADDIFEMGTDGNYAATIELASTETMPSTENPVEAVADNGEIGDITYDASNDQSIVTIPVTAGEASVNYVATFVRKPLYTLTYLDLNGDEIGTQQVEKDAKIGAFAYNIADVQAKTDGYKARGWFKNNYVGEKWTTESVITENVNLYAVETEIEVSSDSRTYRFDLTDKNFDANDHEAFNPTGNGRYHNEHGWIFGNGDKIELLVGKKATISVGLCQYSAAGSTISASNDKSIEAVAETCGSTGAIEYEGEAGTLTLTINSTEGSVYIHSIKIMNTTTTNYEVNGDWIIVKEGDASSLADAIEAAKEGARIFLPNGTYDLGQKTKTTIGRSNVSIIGESMEGVIIKNKPTTEGIDVTATLLNTSSNLYMQDLTIECDAPWITNAERGVTLQDKGNQTILKNVYLKGRQDTYYSNNPSGTFYFEDGKVEGSVDYVCGNGDVYFNKTSFYTVNKSTGGKGGCIAAPNTTTTDKKFGYIFNKCTLDGVENEDGQYRLGRPWADNTQCLYLNTTMNIQPRTEGWGEWSDDVNKQHSVTRYAEYNSMDADGNAISLTGRKTSFKGVANNPVLTEDEAAAYTPEAIFNGDWRPQVIATQVTAPKAQLSKDGKKIEWTPANDGATAYAIFKDGKFLGITTGNEWTIEEVAGAPRRAEEPEKTDYTIRAANSRGGFGPAAEVSPATGIAAIEAELGGDVKIYDLNGRRVMTPTKGVYIINGKKVVIK